MLRRWSVREVYRRRRRARRHYLLKSDALIADGNPLGCFGAILGLGIVTLGGFYGINCLMTTGSLAKLVVAQFSNPLCLLGHTKAMRIFSVLTFATCYGIMVFILARFWGYGLAAHRRSEERRGVEIEHSIDALAGLHPVCVSKLVNATGLQDDIVVAVLHLAAIGALDISRPIDKGKGEEDIVISIVRGAAVTDKLDKATLRLMRAAFRGKASGTVREILERMGASGTSGDTRLTNAIDGFFQASHEEFAESGLRDVSSLPRFSVMLEGNLSWGTTRSMRWLDIVKSSVALTVVLPGYIAAAAGDLPTLLVCGPILILLTSVLTLVYDPGITEKGVEVVRHCAGIREWISEYTCMRESEAADVALWDDNLTYAYVFEVSSEVTDELFAIGNKVTDSYADAYVSKHPVPKFGGGEGSVWGQGLNRAVWRARAL